MHQKKIPSIYFSPSTDENIEVLDLNQLYQRRENLEHNPEEPHLVNFHLMIIIEQGSGSHFIDFIRYDFQAGSILFINKNQVQAFDLSQKLQGKIILFTDDFIDQVQQNMRVPLFSASYLNQSYSPIFLPDRALKASCDALLLEINKETKKSKTDALIIMLLFSSLLLMISKARPTAHKTTLNKKQKITFEKFITLLAHDFTYSRDATYYADKLFITYKTLNHICKLATQQTVKTLIDSYTILEAKRCLVLEKKQIQQLSDELGFDEPSNFIKYFKKHTSLTPSQFLKS